MRALRLLLALASTHSTHAFPWKRHTSAAAIHRRKRRFVRGGAWGFGKGKDSAAEADNATTTDGEGMSQSQIDEALSVVPVFCLADPEGRPVLMTAPEDKDDATKKPLQAFFTDVNVAQAHAARIKELSGDDKLDLKLAVVELGRVLSAGEPEDRKVSLMADPRELHVARQLVLKGAGFRDTNSTGTSDKVVDFSSEASCKEKCKAHCPDGVDLDQGVPLFTLKDLNATVQGDDIIQPWFLSFADLVRAYVNSTGSSDEEEAASGLERLLMEGGVVVGTLDSVLAAARGGHTRRAFMIPPASSLAVMRQQQQAPAAAPKAAPSADDALAAMAADAGAGDGGGGGLFD